MWMPSCAVSDAVAVSNFTEDKVQQQLPLCQFRDCLIYSRQRYKILQQ